MYQRECSPVKFHSRLKLHRQTTDGVVVKIRGGVLQRSVFRRDLLNIHYYELTNHSFIFYDLQTVEPWITSTFHHQKVDSLLTSRWNHKMDPVDCLPIFWVHIHRKVYHVPALCKYWSTHLQVKEGAEEPQDKELKVFKWLTSTPTRYGWIQNTFIQQSSHRYIIPCVQSDHLAPVKVSSPWSPPPMFQRVELLMLEGRSTYKPSALEVTEH